MDDWMLHTSQEDFVKGLTDIFTWDTLTPAEASVGIESYIIQ